MLDVAHSGGKIKISLQKNNMTTPKTLTDREKSAASLGAIFGLPILLPFLVISCQQAFKGNPEMTAYQSLKYNECFAEKRELFKQGLLEADSNCGFWKTAKP